MITIDNFLCLEGNSYTKKLLLETIERISSSTIEKEELTFNVYSVTLFPGRNEVVISDDVSPDENPAVVFPLDEFYAEVKNHGVKEQ